MTKKINSNDFLTMVKDSINFDVSIKEEAETKKINSIEVKKVNKVKRETKSVEEIEAEIYAQLEDF